MISVKQAAYLKGDSTVHQLLYIVHQIRSNWEHNRITQGVFLDVSAAFDKVWHNGLIAKLGQIGIEGNFLNTIKTYLSGRRQVVVVDGVESDVQEVHAGVPQGSRLGPLLFIIYINDITYNLESNILIFADDTSLLAHGNDPAETAAILNRDLLKILDWAKKWKVTFNANKSKDIIFSRKLLNNSPPIMFDNSVINRVNIQKHLGIYLTSSLDWGIQVNEMCLKANRKLSVLRSVKYLDRQTLDILYKLTVRSVFDYGLPVFYNSLKQTEKARLENLQYKAAKLVTGAYHLSSQQKLNCELGWETIKTRSDILGLNIFHKIHKRETRPLIWSCMPKNDLGTNIHLRSKGCYLSFPSKGTGFSKSFFPYISKLWNSFEIGVKNKNVKDFKIHTKTMKPKKIKHFGRGGKEANSLLTKIRIGRSDLNQHKFTIGHVNTPECLCHFKEESPKHFFLDCFLYTQERQQLFSLIGHYIPKFERMNKTEKFNIILFGLNNENEEFVYLNTLITKLVQKFIIKTKRFA